MLTVIETEKKQVLLGPLVEKRVKCKYRWTWDVRPIVYRNTAVNMEASPRTQIGHVLSWSWPLPNLQEQWLLLISGLYMFTCLEYINLLSPSNPLLNYAWWCWEAWVLKEFFSIQSVHPTPWRKLSHQPHPRKGFMRDFFTPWSQHWYLKSWH